MPFKQTIADTSVNWLAMLMTALGLSASGQQFLAGLALAIGLAFVAWGHTDKRTRRPAVVTGTTALMAAVMAAFVLQWYESTIPLPAAMGAAGFFSRFLAAFLVRAGDKAEDSADSLAERVLNRFVGPKS